MDTSFIGKRSSALPKIINSVLRKDWAYVQSFGKVNKAFKKKFKLGSCQLYATGAHLEQLFNISNKLPAWLPFHPSLLKLVPFKNRKKVILAAAFNTLVDEVVDNDMKKNKREAIRLINHRPIALVFDQ